jgi:hypothetical protein
MEYVDCTLTIGDPGREYYAAYKVEFGSLIEGQLSVDPLRRLTVERLNYWVDNYESYCNREVLVLLGLHLYHILFDDKKLEDAFRTTLRDFGLKSRPEKGRPKSRGLRLRLKLIFTKDASKWLAGLPWEFTFVPFPDLEQGFFLTGEREDFVLTRFVPEVGVKANPDLRRPPLRILIVFSQPKGFVELEEREVRSVLDGLKELETKGGVRVRELTNPTYAALRNAIEDEREGLPHILHFIGHGEAGQLMLIKDKDDQDYDSAKGERQPYRTSSKELQALFANHKPRLIFLSACKGAASTEGRSISLESFMNTARDFVYAQVPAVVAMQYNIANIDAQTFAQKFYEEIGQGKGIDEAVKIGRMALGFRPPAWAHRRFGTPVVYLQSDEAIVFPDPMDARQEPGSTPITEQVECQNCKQKNSKTSKFCGACGNSLAQPSISPRQAAQDLWQDKAAGDSTRQTWKA